ncbi:hypothetical protein O3M35_012243 [Rhynocoris fuscipes]|uniref:Uncharacterized protein n=1 Tax=Rhynocoris fuscipes TaxID=488301 RepID=A0AAW1CSY8_9HEMI
MGITLEDVMNELKLNTKETTTMKTNLSSLNATLNTAIEEIKTCKLTTAELRGKLKDQEREINFLKSQLKKNNIIFYNVPEPSDSNVDALQTIKAVCVKAQIDLPELANQRMFQTWKRTFASPCATLFNF